MNKKYLIVLSNGDDINITLANPEAEAWIETIPTFPQNEYSLEEVIPDALFQGFDKSEWQAEIEITTGSWENDRALACPGTSFSSFWDLILHCQSQGVEITGEFIGTIY